jgi:DNA-binding NarL/FixJ family response regulator
MTRIIVADDHSLFRDGIVSMLEAGGFEVVGQAGNGHDTLEAIRRLMPDVVLMDLQMPKMDGLEALKRITAEFPGVKVVILTVSDDDDDLLAAIQAGASGYLLKDLDSEEFLELLAGLERGEAPMTRKTASRLMRRLSSGSGSETALATLSERELDVLALVSQGMPNKAVAERLSISENTVKYHMKNILQKLEVRNRTEAVSHALKHGLVEKTGLAESSAEGER